MLNNSSNLYDYKLDKLFSEDIDNFFLRCSGLEFIDNKSFRIIDRTVNFFPECSSEDLLLFINDEELECRISRVQCEGESIFSLSLGLDNLLYDKKYKNDFFAKLLNKSQLSTKNTTFSLHEMYEGKISISLKKDFFAKEYFSHPTNIIGHKRQDNKITPLHCISFFSSCANDNRSLDIEMHLDQEKKHIVHFNLFLTAAISTDTYPL